MLRYSPDVQRRSKCYAVAYLLLLAAVILCAACSPTRNVLIDERVSSTEPSQGKLGAKESMVEDSKKTSSSEHIADNEKLTDELAQSLRNSEADTRLAVIVEIISPRPSVRFEPHPGRSGTSMRPESINTDNESHIANRFEEAVKYFEGREWSGHQPVFIRAASAVSVEVNPKELKDIMSQDFVRQISHNQHHK